MVIFLITPVLKKGDTTDMIYAQINSFMESKLFKYLSGFPAKHNSQHALLKMIETWRAMLNKGNKFGAIVMDLSKAFRTDSGWYFQKKKP